MKDIKKDLETDKVIKRLNAPPIKQREQRAVYIHKKLWPVLDAIAALEGLNKNDSLTLIFTQWIKENYPGLFNDRILPILEEKE